MHKDDEGQWGEFDFGVEAMTMQARRGMFPTGYLDAYIRRQQARHARIAREIEGEFSAASADPEMLALLNRPLS